MRKMHQNSLENLNKRVSRKGKPNKFTDLKSAFLNAFQSVGGEAYLTEFAKAKRNQAAFLQMIAKMLPTTSSAKVEQTGSVKFVFERPEKADEDK